MNQLLSQLAVEFQDKEYRHAYVEDFLNATIAAQIKALRESRGWTQAQLAERAGMKQSRISLLENVNYSAWSMSTLKKLAAAFDVALSVRFESFGRRMMDIENFSAQMLVVPPFEMDPLCHSSATVTTIAAAESSAPAERVAILDALREDSLGLIAGNVSPWRDPLRTNLAGSPSRRLQSVAS